MTDLLLGLGAAVVKAACKIWLKDSEFASDVSAEVADVVRAKIAGELDQRNARRLFEDLEVPVAKKLAGLREHEFRGMPDHEWNAAVLTVGDTLRRARFTDTDIFEGDLDPLYLRRKVIVGSPAATRDLSEAGAALYGRLLTECCAYVVELTSTLPRFNPGAFGEILRRQSVILQRVSEVLERMPGPELSAWNDVVPFLIRLRRSVGKELPAPENFVREVGRHIAADMPQGWVHRLLRQGRALVLVDGVDELPEAQRRQARDWLTGLVDAFPDARYVVTSRPGAASSTWLDRQGFDAAEVQPMGWADVREFVRHWHDAFRAESGDQDRQEQVLASEATLLESLYARRHLRALATSPLLCALLCALNLDRRAQLPEERMELYAVALDMLLERRDIERLIPASGASLSKTSKTLLLEDLAYWLIRSGWSDASRERVADRLSRKLSTMPRAATDDETAVLDALIVRSGLIREPVAGRVDFVHRTFEEYLAARAAVADDQSGELVRNAHNDQWREVIVMAAGHAHPRQRAELLSGLLARAEDEPKNRQALQTLAVACLETSPQLDPALHARIQAVAEALLPPKGFRQAEILARIGEPLLDLLAERPPRGQRQAAATVRAASMVGGHAALPIIARCAKTAGRSVDDELMRAWPLFNVKEFAEQVLSGSPHAWSVGVSDPSLLPGLSYIDGLCSVELSISEGDGDLSFVRDLPYLVMLNIMDDRVAWNLAPLGGHPALCHLLIQGFGQETDLSPLPDIPKLSKVRLFVDKVRSLESLRACTGSDSGGDNRYSAASTA